MDAKRQGNNTGRVATPKAVGASGSDLDALLTKAIGSRYVSLTLYPLYLYLHHYILRNII